MAWSRRVDWCAAVAIPLVTLTAFLNPIDAFASAVNYGMMRRGITPGQRVWLAGDVAPAWRTAVRPPDHRPRRGRRTSKARGRVRP